MIEKIGLGGSCHWCTEAIFQSFKGVVQVEQGWIASEPPNQCLSEAVVVHFEPETISLELLIEAHLYSHSATSEHSMREKYRSAVYYFDTQQQAKAKHTLTRLQTEFSQPLITQTLIFVEFKASPERYQNYYSNDPERPFCQNIIQPKLQKLIKRFSAQMKALN